MAEDETTFLCGFSRPRRYGTTSLPIHVRPSYSSVVEHPVQPTDTIQGIVLKYGSSMTEIKRVNKLWSNDSIHYKDVLLVPVLSSETPSPSATPCPTLLNGHLHTSRSSNRLAPDSAPGGSKGKQTVGSVSSNSPSSLGGSRTPTGPSPPAEDFSVNDIFSRIDKNIKETAQSVRKLERESTVDTVIENDSGTMSAASSTQSFTNPVFSRHSVPPSDTDVRTEGSKFKPRKLKKLQEGHDNFYQL